MIRCSFRSGRARALLAIAAIVVASCSSGDDSAGEIQPTTTVGPGTETPRPLAPAPPAPAVSQSFNLVADWDAAQMTITWSDPIAIRGACGWVYGWSDDSQAWFVQGEGGHPYWIAFTSLSESERTIREDPSTGDDPMICPAVGYEGRAHPDSVTLSPEMLDYEHLIYCQGEWGDCASIPPPR